MKKRLRKAVLIGEHMCAVVVMAGAVYAAMFMNLYAQRKNSKSE